jgi:choline dehydrogenase-like flavoprotein
LGGLAYNRFFKSRLQVPVGTASHLQLDVEQVADSRNRVYLGDEIDRAGRRVATVQWDIHQLDHERIQSLSARLLGKWPSYALGAPRLVADHAADSTVKPHDAYHPVGTCRMGTDGESIVDLELRVKGTRNLFVLSTGVLPTAGTANPTFTMLCLGDRLADRIGAQNMQAKSA